MCHAIIYTDHAMHTTSVQGQSEQACKSKTTLCKGYQWQGYQIITEQMGAERNKSREQFKLRKEGLLITLN
jgi:hypothetical protein